MHVPATNGFGSNAMFKLPGRLDGLLRRGYMLPKGAEEEIPLIKRDLEEIIAILSKLEDDHAAMVRCWMKEVRELWYDIEDFIDQYEHAATGSRTRSIPARGNKVITWWRRRKTATPPWRHEKLRQRLWMASKIREFSVRAQEALQRLGIYNLGALAGTSSTRCTVASSSRSRRPALYCAGYDVHVGIGGAMNELEEWLMAAHGEQKKLKVVSIVGFGGVGKTTLANELYRKLGQQFECKAFVRTSQKPDMRRLFISMISQVRPDQPPDNWKVHSLISSIRTHLQDKRYLIIIDDLWSTSTWDIIKCAIPDGNSCSRILTTTEIEDVALQSFGYDSKYVFKMKPLGEDASRKLFFSSLFGPKCECPPELREISYDIIRKCGGLPLAIVTIASLLASQPFLQEQWDHVNKSLGYSLITNPTWEGMKQVLNLSYNNLPQHLKACMLYMSIYQEDNIIWKDDLVNQWIAEGFIWATEGQDKQEISGAYFDELVSRKMIQPVDTKGDGEVLSCVVHHVVLNHISACKSIEENFVTAIHHSQTTTILADKVRRLSLHFGNAEDAVPPTNMRLSQVRTLAFFGVFKCMPSIAEFRLLQILILHFWGDKDSISLDLTQTSELFRLRYLKVTSNVTLELQTQMRGLQHLETIKIDARVCSIPSEIVRLPGLLHLSLTAETGLPNGMGHMTSLRTLGYFDLSGNSMENVWSLSKLTNLRDLQLTCSTIQPDNLNYKMQHLLGSILGRLNNLKSLTLVPTTSYYANSLDDAGATGMSISGYGFSIASSPLILLQRLEFSPRICVFSCLPKFIGQLSKLCILKIGVKEIVRDDVDVLRGLPALSVLSLYVHTKPAERIVIGKAGFWVLKYFKFKCCDPRLKFDADAMRNLRILKLCFNAPGADQRSRIPVGIENLSSLKEVSAEIGGGAGPEESDRRAAELAFRDAMRVHARCPRVTVKCVNQIFGCKEDHSNVTREEEYGALKQCKILEEVSADEIMEDPGQGAIKHADSRFTFSEWHMLLLLRNKLDNQHDDITGCIPVFDPYSVDPWKLAENSAGLLIQEPRFFFCPLEEARRGRPSQAPSGYWEAATGSAGYIYSAEGLSIGVKRTMEFYRGCKPSGIKTRWKMEEFTAFQKATAGGTDARLTPRSKMSLCQLYIEPVTISAGSAGYNPPGLLKAEEQGALKQYGIPKDEPTEKDEIIQNFYGKNTNKQAYITRVQSSTVADGYSWRKYGQKDVLGAKHTRAYYRCTHRHSQSCAARKQVQRTDEDPTLFDVIYHGTHTCVDSAPASSSTSTSTSQASSPDHYVADEH